MMKRKKRILIGGSIVLIAAICGAILLFSGKTQPTKSLAKQVEEDYTGIEEIINQAVEKNENLAMSSNPYEYVKNNSYYDRLVSKGISILPILEKKINENQYGDGLLGYITAIAIEDITECNLKEDKDLHIKLDAFKKFLVHDMTEEQFADFYAQTIVYGMFIARIYDKSPSTFSLQEASELIPSINPFLKKIFKQLALAELHSGVKWIVEELIEIFKVTKMERILHNYGKDPLVHFYEDFLAEYNPKIREEFGVWYTPKEVVGFIVDAVDHLLRTELSINDGLANNTLIEYNGKQTH